MGHGFCQRSWGLCVALVACLVLCLEPGAEAIKCKRCRAKNDEVCRPQKKTCKDSRDGAVCMVGRKYIGDRLIETFMKCSVDKLTCGAEVTIPDEGFRLQINCCSDRDFCSNYMQFA